MDCKGCCSVSPQDLYPDGSTCTWGSVIDVCGQCTGIETDENTPVRDTTGYTQNELGNYPLYESLPILSSSDCHQYDAADGMTCFENWAVDNCGFCALEEVDWNIYVDECCSDEDVNTTNYLSDNVVLRATQTIGGHNDWVTTRGTPVKFTYFKSPYEPELLVDLNTFSEATLNLDYMRTGVGNSPLHDDGIPESAWIENKVGAPQELIHTRTQNTRRTDTYTDGSGPAGTELTCTNVQFVNNLGPQHNNVDFTWEESSCNCSTKTNQTTGTDGCLQVDLYNNLRGGGYSYRCTCQGADENKLTHVMLGEWYEDTDDFYVYYESCDQACSEYGKQTHHSNFIRRNDNNGENYPFVHSLNQGSFYFDGAAYDTGTNNNSSDCAEGTDTCINHTPYIQFKDELIKDIIDKDKGITFQTWIKSATRVNYDSNAMMWHSSAIGDYGEWESANPNLLITGIRNPNHTRAGYFYLTTYNNDGSNDTLDTYEFSTDYPEYGYSIPRIDDGKWHQVTLTINKKGDNTNLKIYIDAKFAGVLSKATSNFAFPIEWSTIVFGGDIDGFKAGGHDVNRIPHIGQGFYGMVNGMRVWAGEYVPPVLHWKGDEGSGTSIPDYSDFGHIGAIDGATWVNDSVDGNVVGNYLKFDSLGQKISNQYFLHNTDNNSMTAMGWMKCASDTECGGGSFKGFNQYPGFILGPRAEGQNGSTSGLIHYEEGSWSYTHRGVNCADETNATAPADCYYGGRHQLNPPNLGYWHHYALVYDFSSRLQTLYIDGVPKNVKHMTNSGTITEGTGPIYFGLRESGEDHWFNGFAKDLRFYEVPLSQDQILDIIGNRVLDVFKKEQFIHPNKVVTPTDDNDVRNIVISGINPDFPNLSTGYSVGDDRVWSIHTINSTANDVTTESVYPTEQPVTNIADYWRNDVLEIGTIYKISKTSTDWESITFMYPGLELYGSNHCDSSATIQRICTNTGAYTTNDTDGNYLNITDNNSCGSNCTCEDLNTIDYISGFDTYIGPNNPSGNHWMLNDFEMEQSGCRNIPNLLKTTADSPGDTSVALTTIIICNI